MACADIQTMTSSFSDVNAIVEDETVSNVVPVILELFDQQEKKNALMDTIFKDFNVESTTSSINDFIQTKIAEERLEEGFFVFNFAALASQYAKWTQLMPRVEPFYGKPTTSP